MVEGAQRRHAEQLEIVLEDYVRRLERVGLLIDALELERDALTRSLADRDVALVDARDEIAHLQLVVEDLQHQNREIVTSTSWQSTALLRRLSTLVRPSPDVADLPSALIVPDGLSDAPAHPTADAFAAVTASVEEIHPGPSVLIVSYGMIAGGGETFPIFLANGLRARGVHVVLVDAGYVAPVPGIVALAHESVPRHRLDDITELGLLCDHLAIDVVHTCHAATDVGAADALRDRPDIAHVVTLHGMYEAMPLDDVLQCLPRLRRVDSFTYTARKNLTNFPPRFVSEHDFRPIPNLTRTDAVAERSRCELGIADDAVVATLVARAVAGKGLERARAAVEIVRARRGVDLHLVVIGDGPALDLMRATDHPSWLHLLGFRSDVQAWSAVTDVALLPSSFPGESYPLALVDFLRAGVPAIASDIGEIPSMMSSPVGYAGSVVPIVDGEVPLAGLAQALEAFVDAGPDERSRIDAACAHAADALDFERVLDAYEAVYAAAREHRSSLTTGREPGGTPRLA